MTLLIGTISKRHIVITADGLSWVNPTTGAGIGSDTYQKVFPIPGIPIAFAHHGLNILMGKSIGEFIGDYISQYGTRISTANIKEIAEDLRSYTAESAEIILADPSNKGIIGFWIAGFSPGKGKSELYEVSWPDSPDPCKHEIIVLDGDAKQFIITYLDQSLGRFHPNSIWQSSVDFVCRYHQALYKKAKDK
jgi:hypothetical protein